MSPMLGATDYALLGAQRQSLELILSGAALDVVLGHLVQIVEQQSQGQAIASIMRLDEDGRMRNAAAPSLPEEYLAAIDGLPADPTLGTCCAAAARNAIVVTPDFTCDVGWRGIAHLPLGLGLKGAWSMPIRSRDGLVLGTFGTYFRECREPTGHEREVIEVLARIAAIAIERDDAEHAREAQTRELIAARDAAEAASRAKSQFLAVMSHELRTPLTGVVGFADLLAAQIDGPLTPTQVDQALRIKAGAWHLVSIIDEILTFSRLEAGRENLRPESVDLRTLVRECVNLMQAAAAAAGTKLAVTGNDASPLLATTDAGKTRQVILNLIGNALKFTVRGAVDVTVAAQDPDAFRVVVRDTGCGIPEAKRDTIFEPFVQVDQTHTRRAGGTGLGLTVSRRLAELLGGSVMLVQSEIGKGSTFAFELPATLTLPESSARAAPPVPSAFGVHAVANSKRA